MALIRPLAVVTPGSPGRTRATTGRQGSLRGTPPSPPWRPPEVDGELKIALGGSFVDEFVLSHRPIDVLRELVQNEFDADGQSLEVMFEIDMLSVHGSGRPITRKGWKRLSVIAGTGRTIGDDSGEIIEPKTNGIGSKNFGLRSMFLFGNRMFVRSAGQVAVLDLPTLGTKRMADAESHRQEGVSVHIGYRERQFAKLPAFTPAEEAAAFDSMAGGVLSTLMKLALSGSRQGLRRVTIASERLGRSIRWQQRAEKVECKAPGVVALRRSGRMVETQGDAEDRRVNFEELEFARVVSLDPAVPPPFDIPGYFLRAGDRVRIAVSMPIERGRPRLFGHGHFYYPLQAPRGGTGTAIDVSAPFELNGDRSALHDHDWNRWLCRQAANLVLDLLSRDWFDRFGAAAFSALLPRDPAEPSAFVEALTNGLSEAGCWPTESLDPKERFAPAESLVVPVDPALSGHVGAAHQVDKRIGEDERLRALAIASGAKAFTTNSLVRLRCAPADRGQLETKLGPTEADWSFPDYDAALRDVDRQVAMAVSLGQLGKLSNENLRDLRRTRSTLTKSLDLAAATDLVKVDPLVIDCPRPAATQLHPSLFEHRAIASLCDPFDEEKWIREVCERSSTGQVDLAELMAVEARILATGAAYGRLTLAAIRRSAVVRDHHGNWVAPGDMLHLAGRSRSMLFKVLSAPSLAMARQGDLGSKLRLRSVLDAGDLVRVADWIANHPDEAEKFEQELARHQGLLTRNAVRRLLSIAFFRTAAGGIEAPERLHLDNPLNRLCVPAERIVAGGRTDLYRSLLVREAPDEEAILDTLEALAEARTPPTRPDVFYAVLANAAKQERSFHAELQDRSVLWASGEYHRPRPVLAGHAVSRLFDGAVPVVRGPDAMVRSYLDIGASPYPLDSHWQCYFEAAGERLADTGPVASVERRALLDAYALRASAGLPEDLPADTHCLLDRRNRLHSLEDVEVGRLVENDFTALADAIDRNDLEIGIVDLVERSRPFFRALGLRRLSSICGAGRVHFGDEAPPIRWFDPQHRADLLQQIRAPLFVSAVHKLAMAFQQRTFPAAPEAHFRDALERLERIEAFETITRQYQLQSHAVSVDAEVGTLGSTLGIVRPKTKLDIHQLIAQALAELVGFTQVADARLFAASIIPLFLCRSARETGVFLTRQGIVTAEEEEGFDFDDDPDSVELNERNELVDDAFAGILGSLSAKSEPPTPPNQTSPPPPTPPSPPSPAFELPPLDSVTATEEAIAGRTIDVKSAPGGGGGGSWGYGWRPPTAADTERDNKLGMRGEELVYRQELDRVRALGYDHPEEHVVWTSLTHPGADHDIRSIDAEGRPIWLEVKATSGSDGRFLWPRREFELAMAAGSRYELCRVYEAATTRPRIKRFPDPVRLLSSRQLSLDLSDLRANVESAG